MGELTDKVKGTAKEATGKARATTACAAKARPTRSPGDVKGKANDAKDALRDKVGDVPRRLHDKDEDDKA